MKIWVNDFNSVNTLLIGQIKEMGFLTDNLHDADLIILWNDVRGDCERVARTAKMLGKEVWVMQHGRGATRDYDKPNNFPMIADKFLCWGPAERRRLTRLGYGDRAVVVGSPLILYLVPKQKSQATQVFFSPIIMEKEEPENLMVYAKIKQWESKRLFKRIKKDYVAMKSGWGTKITKFTDQAKTELHQAGKLSLEETPHIIEYSPYIPHEALYSDGMLTMAPTPMHDHEKYHAMKVVLNQGLVPQLVGILAQTDVVVCIEEGTLALLATAMNIPVLHADVFKYTTYAGTKYDDVELIRTTATYRVTNFDAIPEQLDKILETDHKLIFKQMERVKVVEDELGPQYGNPIKNIMDLINEKVTAQMPVMSGVS